MRAILFDLDNTLLDIDLDAFLRRYFVALGEVTALHFEHDSMLPAIIASTSAMQRPHPGRTNKEVFNDDFMRQTGVDLDEHWDVFDRFYSERFPSLGGDAKPGKGASRAVEVATALGLRTVVATQPIFPRPAIEARLAWAGLADAGLDVLTTYDNMHWCKPHPDYFREAAAMAGCDAAECIMVGDDRVLDMPAAAVGMRTYYVGADPLTAADFHGDLDDLAELLPRL